MANCRTKRNYLAGLLVASALLVGGMLLDGTAMAQNMDKGTTLTGTVTDLACGLTHKMQGMSAKECTLGCTKMGSNYALVVGGKVYTLWVKGATAGETLAELAGGQAKVTGKVDGNTIYVNSVAHI